MKTKIFMTIAAAATLLSACNKENEIETLNDELILSSGVSVQQTKAGGIVPDTQIANEQKVKVNVSAHEDYTGETYLGFDGDFEADGNGGLTGPTVKFPTADGTKDGVNIYAYHPSTAGTTFTIEADQSADVDYYNSDLLYSDTAYFERTPGAKELQFKHKLSKLTFTLAKGNGITDEEFNGASVKWRNIKRSAAFDRATGNVGAATGSGETITPHETYGAIIIPQTVPGGTQLLEITLGGGAVLKYIPGASEQQVFDGGNKYKYTITVTKSGLIVESSVTDWADGGNKDVETNGE